MSAKDLDDQNIPFKFDTSKIPTFRKEEMLRAMTAPMTEFFARPDTQEKFEKWLAKRKAAEAAE